MENNINNRYPALKIVSGIYIFYSVIIGLVSLILTIYFLLNKEWINLFSCLIGGGLLTVLFIAFSESIKLFIDIERNTRNAFNFLYNEKKEIKSLKNISEIEENILLDENIENIDQINKLHSLILFQKSSLFGEEKKSEIIQVLLEICIDKEQAIKLLAIYEKKFNRDLLKDLESLTTSYSGIKKYLKVFIDFEIIMKDYPHNRI